VIHYYRREEGAMQLEAGSTGHRTSIRPVVAALVLIAVVAIGFAVVRPQSAPTERPAVSTAWGVERAALAEAGYTGRLGGVGLADWSSAARAAGFTGRVGAAVEPADWTESAVDAGFTGRLGG
jgi:hypothetical protein